jgi:5-methylcytosine-specific restriction endonuclease McrA
MQSFEEFEFWRGEYLENPQALDSETRRLLAVMCQRENPYALAYAQREDRERRGADARPESLDLPLNTVGNIDERDVDLSRPAIGEADYPDNWFEIALALKSLHKWRCEVCLFQKQGSSLIQVHHIDGDKSDNQRANLQVLCAKCHGDKHSNPPVWPIGVSALDQEDLLAYHRSRSRAKRGTLSGET